MSPKESEVLHEKIEELLKKGYIQESISPYVVSALLRSKKGGSWRMCVDSQAINKIMVRYLFPIPRLDDLLDQLAGKFVVVYFNDILIYSKEEEHLGHLRKVMKALADNDSFVNLYMCAFLTNKLLFLSYIVSLDGIHIDETKVQKDPFQWNREEEERFKIIKEKLTTTPVLSLPNFDKVFELEYDACRTRIGNVLSQ
ncbi:putative reverse transcriptase domain-containing protein [Tanacetum coccineum]